MRRIYCGILLLSAATLLFEINLTRVFSVAEWYHFAFMVVSLALFGFGASGSFLSLFPRLLMKKLSSTLAILALLFSLSCLVSYLIVNTIPFDSYRLALENRQLAYLVVYYLSLAVPFFFAGLVLGISLSKLPSKAGRIYGFNMVGSGVGCLLVLVSPSVFGGGGTVVLAALIGMASVFLFALPGHRRLLGLTTAGCFVLVVLLVSLAPILEVKMSPYKDLSQVLFRGQTRILWTGWNSFSRVDVVESSSIHVAPGLSFNNKQELPPQFGLTVDGTDLSPVSRIGTRQAYFTEYLPGALVYRLSPDAKALVIEPRGGLDLLTALHYRCSSVVVVVSNPLIVEALERVGEKQHLLEDPRVDVAVEGIRSYLRRSPERFDVIQLSLTDSFHVVAAGAYSLSENYSYTVEAFEEYYQHLAPGGIFVLAAGFRCRLVRKFALYRWRQPR